MWSNRVVGEREKKNLEWVKIRDNCVVSEDLGVVKWEQRIADRTVEKKEYEVYKF